MQRQGRRRVTAADVAARAGASRSAVSLVLNGRADGNVAPVLQDQIRAAVEELGYIPQSVGQSLRSRSTRTVGVITDEIVTSPFAGGIISGADAVAREAGYMIMVADTAGDDSRIGQMAEVFFARSVDALMLATGGLVSVDPAENFFSAPAVLANCLDASGRAPAVVADEAGGSRLGVRHLLDLGHRDIALLSGTEDSPATPRRREGFLDAVAGTGAEHRVVPCGWDIDDGYRAASALLDGGAAPTAVLASNDRTAVGVLLAAAHRGVDIPGDLSVVGVDDQAHVAAQVVPALTTVALPHQQIGRRAMEILLEGIPAPSGEPSAGAIPELIETWLIRRDSTGAAPTS
ncbi:LacI family DNA-binding transcriptional regulator [Nesterenkonia sp. HG001]|uniref:LacI family DNA-binding transcriptional regulator n=1 Tax=Nesterenkonia sp. HG001 TaxID=2983207 RepID=UPI002AC4DCE4|nr:LacI family DNA-binding transcriptional regulator [Nesterenkonia sp. HG001]MDZ5076836.1 LacI family DNA-binding transcriptional regulator [Nesterenkonia sp. HG001]